ILLEDELEALVQESRDEELEKTGPAPAVPPAEAPAFAPGVALSKFRSPPPAEKPAARAAATKPSPEVTGSPGTTARGATLGRVRPKRVRAHGGDPGPQADPLLRLLAD